MAKGKKKPAKKSLFSRLADAFQEEEYDFEGNKIDPDQTSEDVDKGIESEITAIKNTDVTLLEGDGLLGGGWGSDGDSINIMDLTPIFAMIGGPQGRQADNLRETCERVFDERVTKGDGRASVQGDKFLMRFLGASEAEGFYLAAIIVNDIGNHILGGRFVALEAPALLVVGDGGRPDRPRRQAGSAAPDVHRRERRPSRRDEGTAGRCARMDAAALGEEGRLGRAGGGQGEGKTNGRPREFLVNPGISRRNTFPRCLFAATGFGRAGATPRRQSTTILTRLPGISG